MQDNKTLIYGAIAGLVLLWGTAFTLIGYAVDYVSPVWIVATRTTIAAIVLTAYTLLRGHRFPPLKDKRWLWYLAIGFIGLTLPFYFTARGQMHVDSGLAAILIGFMPMITIVLAHFFVEGEALNWRRWIGFVVGFIGIVLLFLPEPFAWELISNWKSQGFILLSAVCYSVMVILVKRAPKTPASLGTAMMLIMGAAMSLVWAVVMDGVPPSLPPTSVMLALAALAVGATGFANILYFRLVEVRGPGLIAKINYIVPICSLIAGIIFLNEQFSMRAVLAMAVIITGLLIVRSGDTKS